MTPEEKESKIKTNNTRIDTHLGAIKKLVYDLMTHYDAIDELEKIQRELRDIESTQHNPEG